MKNFEPSILTSIDKRKIDLNVVQRIMFSIDENRNARITNIAANTKLNYKRCVRYIQLLSSYELILVTRDGICVSQRGRELLDLIQNIRNYFAKN